MDTDLQALKKLAASACGETDEGMAALKPSEWAVDPLRIAWTSEVARNTANPEWGDACIYLKDLCGTKPEDRNRPLVIQCWDWDRTTPHDFIGAKATTLTELLQLPSFVLEASEPARELDPPMAESTKKNRLTIRRCDLQKTHTIA